MRECVVRPQHVLDAFATVDRHKVQRVEPRVDTIGVKVVVEHGFVIFCVAHNEHWKHDAF